jgi:ferredoxin
MPRLITDACVACGNAPVNVQLIASQKATSMLLIRSKCIDCGACQEVCPVEAIIEE